MTFMKAALPFGPMGMAGNLLKSGAPSLITGPHPSKPQIIPPTIIRGSLVNPPLASSAPKAKY